MIDVLGHPDPLDLAPVDDTTRAAAEQAFAAGWDALDAGDLDRAAELYSNALELDPHNAKAWFDLGLVFKWRRSWPESMACNRHAGALSSEVAEDPAFWNLGIAATAEHRWDLARWAWTSYGIELPDGEGPIEADFGSTPVRIFSEVGDTEVVWGRRLDPARVRIDNVPLPSSGHRWGDIVLHDGAPNGKRESGGHVYSVFDELMRWQPSEVNTLECLVTADRDAISEIASRFDRSGWRLENWTEGVRMLCQQCSESDDVPEHDHGPFSSRAEGEHIGIAAPVDLAVELLDSWLAEQQGRSRTDIIEASA